MMGVQRLTLPAVFIVVVAAVLTLTGTVESGAVLGAAILLAIAAISFQLGTQYQDIKRGS